MRVPIVGGGLGMLALIVITLLLGGDPSALLNMGGGPSSVQVQQGGEGVNDPLAQFVSVVLADTEDVWHEQFARMGKQYKEPSLVLFTEQAQSACGFASAAVGPFYCPLDEKVYVDLS